MTRSEIEAALLAWIAEGAESPRDEARFEALALPLFSWQHAHNASYRKMCRAFGVHPENVSRWRDIPPVPTGAFKEARLACFPPERTLRVFRTSGTTTQGRGELHLDTLELYEASLVATFGAYLCPDTDSIRMLVLAPTAEEAPDSSLSYMFSTVVRRLGSDASRSYVHAQGWESRELLADLELAREPVALLGTAFAFVHLLDALEAAGLRLALPLGSRAMETGGFKGRSRELPRETLHGALCERLGLRPEEIVNQYGMCELATQLYEPSLRNGRPTRCKRIPPWMRTRAVDPATLEDVATGAVGVLVHYDLANTGSVLAVQTSDRGRVTPEGVEVLGRLEGAEARGCSIAADALLGDAAPRP